MKRPSAIGVKRVITSLTVAVAALVFPGVASATIKTYSAGAAPGRMARAADGSMWFTKDGAVGRITTAGAVRTFGLPALNHVAPSDVLGIAAAADGSAWATEAISGAIAHIEVSGKVTEFTPAVPGMPAGIAVGPDGQVWFSDVVQGRITRFDQVSNFFDTILGSVVGAYFRVDPASPTEMVVAPDQAVWILQLAPGRVGRMTADAAVSYHWLPGGAASQPTGIAVGPDGALWIAEAGTNRIARMALDGTVREIAIPSAAAEPRAIAAGPDGAMWFTEFGRDRLGRIDAAGHVTEIELPAGSAPYGVVGGADGAIWTTLQGKGGQVARVTTDTPPTAKAARRVVARKQPHKAVKKRSARRHG